MKGNNIYFAKSAVWGVSKCILQCMQSASQIQIGQKPNDHMAGLEIRDKMQWMLIAQVHSYIAIQVPNKHTV